METLYLGLDVHKVNTSFCFMNHTGGEGSIRTEDVSALVEHPNTSVVLEATGHWHSVYDGLLSTGARVSLAHPGRIKAIASAKVKTDKIDARIFAHLLRADLIPAAWAPPQLTRDLRDLVRLRWGFITSQTKAKNRTHALLAREGLRFEGSDLFGPSGLRWIAAQPLREHTRGLVDQLLKSVDENQVYVDALTDKLKMELRGDPAVKILTTIPGVGFITAATLIAELGDFKRFSSGKQVASYFGLVPSVRASGSVAHYGKITKGGSGHARRALVEAAHISVRLPGPIRQKYLSLSPRRGKRVAIVASARTLLTLSWTLLIRGEVFREAA